MSKENTPTGGIGIFGALFLIFTVMKLAEAGTVADWSWWRVTSPLWGGFIFFFVLALGISWINSIAKDWK